MFGAEVSQVQARQERTLETNVWDHDGRPASGTASRGPQAVLRTAHGNLSSVLRGSTQAHASWCVSNTVRSLYKMQRAGHDSRHAAVGSTLLRRAPARQDAGQVVAALLGLWAACVVWSGWRATRGPCRVVACGGPAVGP